MTELISSIRPELLCAAVLALLLVAAAVIDVRQRRIPNWLTGGGIVVGLLLQGFAPFGWGLFEYRWGSPGLLPALYGMGLGLALFLPLYLLRAVGAGDVKLLAMTGVWLGPKLLFGATLLTLLVGGAMALAMMVASGTTRRVTANVRWMLTTAMVDAHSGRVTAFDAAATSGVRMPYAVAICSGVLLQVGWLIWQANR
jgi:prepilin peptidase CpaA